MNVGLFRIKLSDTECVENCPYTGAISVKPIYHVHDVFRLKILVSIDFFI